MFSPQIEHGLRQRLHDLIWHGPILFALFDGTGGLKMEGFGERSQLLCLGNSLSDWATLMGKRHFPKFFGTFPSSQKGLLKFLFLDADGWEPSTASKAIIRPF